jgi:hypothetical protein
MAWSSPKTWASGYVVLAADLNNVRDQLNATAPATVTAQGDIVIASGANALARLAKSTTSTQYLANTGTSNAPAWNEVALATGVSGTLPVGNGGTGATTLTANGALVGNGTSAIASVDMSTKGGLLAGDGTGNPSVLAVGGTGGHVLTVDSSETTGMKWAASSAPYTSLLTGTSAIGANTITGFAIKDAAESQSFYIYSAYSTGADIYQGAYISATETIAAISHVRIGRADADAGGTDSFYCVNGSGGSVTFVYQVIELN